MKLGILFSGGKDSCYAAYLAKQSGHEISCLITIVSKNKESYMFHTPSINKVEKQAEQMQIPVITIKTKGEKEAELIDLKKAIKVAIKKYKINGIATGAVESVYQGSRIQKICNDLNIECFNPLWQKNQIQLLNELIKNKFKIIVTGVFAYPLDKNWLGREIDKKFVLDITKLNEKYKINPAGEGGEFETFVIDCPLFKKALKVKGYNDFGEKNSLRREIEI
ncbi:tRNA-specific 2-thiouridylase MnmA [uncultured archaeon]|nr:tRNA-specific 2-thiouridylase MnmA [uncultured archaeon]